MSERGEWVGPAILAQRIYPFRQLSPGSAIEFNMRTIELVHEGHASADAAPVSNAQLLEEIRELKTMFLQTLNTITKNT